jgi:hypothetical protein
VIAAGFTCRLGVAGTLIGMELTAMVITLSSAIFKAQLMKASHHLASLPKWYGAVLRTADSHPRQSERGTEPRAVHARQGPGLLSRLRAMPGFLRELPSLQRPKVRLAGLLAGLVATVIGLGNVTGIELIGGKTLSSMIWSCPERIPARKSHPVARVSPS